MTIAELTTLNAKEKIRMMESLWESLCMQSPELISPKWHGDILAEREEATHNGIDSFEDWDTAKAALRNSGQ